MNSSGYGSGQQTYEAPACVQNAMMTKDKKPFTYTPGGLDLSQIKSERMAKRLARNAQAEGANGQSQMHRPTQPHSPGSGSTGTAAASMGAAAMGMPFQVLPPPPPPPPGKQANGSLNAPPPPPQPAQNSLAPNMNGGSPSPARKSPSPAPQRFEPPPMGFRPEIKIPPNPMASLRKVPPPVEKNTFWKDAYIKERSKSPMPDTDVTDHSSVVQPIERNDDAYKMPSNVINNNNSQAYGKSSPDMQRPLAPQFPQQQQLQQQRSVESPKLYQQPQQQQQQQQRRSPSPRNYPAARSPSPRPYQQNDSPRTEFRSVAPPQSPNVNVYTTPNSTTEQRSVESPFKFANQTVQPQQPQPQQQQQQPVSQTVPWRTHRAQQPNNNMSSQQQPQQPQPYTQSVQQDNKPTNVGSLYIAPLQAPAEPQAQHIIRQMQQQQQPRNSPIRQVPAQQQQSQLRQAAPWMKSQPPPREQPEWVRPDEPGNIVPSSLNRIKSPPPPQQQEQPSTTEVRYQPQAQPQSQAQFYPQQNKQYDTQNHQQQQQQQQQQYRYNEPHLVQGNGFAAPSSAATGLRLQINTTPSGASKTSKEHIIPIQLEQTPTYTPSQPNFNVQATSGNKSPAGYVIRSPNQFVDQGYHNFANNNGGTEPQRIMSPTQQLNAPRLIQQQQQQSVPLTQNVGGTKTRIVPIAVEGESAGGPVSKAPIVLQNDVRTTPIQSKSFRVLQHITDTMAGDEVDGGVGRRNDNIEVDIPQLQRPTFARQMSAQQARHSPTIEQMRRMQINSDQQQSPAWSQNNQQSQQPYVHPSQQQVPQPKIYTGSNIPSRSFKILQSITTPENAGPGQSDL